VRVVNVREQEACLVIDTDDPTASDECMYRAMNNCLDAGW